MTAILERDVTPVELERLFRWEADDARARGSDVLQSQRLSVVAVEAGRYVGCAVLQAHTHADTPTGWAFVEELYLEPPYRRRGLGTVLLRHVEAQGYALGVRNVWTQTAGYEAPAFYVRRGYRVCFELPEYFRSGHSLVGLRKALGPPAAGEPTGVPPIAEVVLEERAMTTAENARMQRGFVEHGIEFDNPESSPERHGFVAVIEGELTGCVSGLAYRDGEGPLPWLFVTNLFVAEPYRNQGVASELLRRLEHRVASLGMQRVWAQIPSYWGIDFLGKRGYTALAEFEDWAPGSTGLVTLASTV